MNRSSNLGCRQCGGSSGNTFAEVAPVILVRLQLHPTLLVCPLNWLQSVLDHIRCHYPIICTIITTTNTNTFPLSFVLLSPARTCTLLYHVQPRHEQPMACIATSWCDAHNTDASATVQTSRVPTL